MTRVPSSLMALTLSAALAALALLAIDRATASAETLPLSRLLAETHIHGLAVDGAEPSRLHVATHHGLFLASPDGTATRLSESRDDLMGFVPHPAEGSILYASGHPAGGGNLGVMISEDGGRTWRQLATGAGGPVDFHEMAVSRADPQTLYGVHGGLQVSRDGGRTWQAIGPAPQRLLDLAASAVDRDILYAATETGLLFSTDAGRSWTPATLRQQPATVVATSPDGQVYAFVVGTGLIRAAERGLSWTTLAEGFGDRVLLHLAIDPSDGDRLYAATQRNEILASADGGRTWTPFGSR